MRINSIKHNGDRYYLSVTFCDDIEERDFLHSVIHCFEKGRSVHCILTDLDTSYSAYEDYFPRGNYYVFDHLTSASIFAFELNHAEIQDVISNWGYYTLAAMFALGTFEEKLKNQHLDCMPNLNSMPVVITQVLDNSLDINLEQCYFEKMLKLLEK